MAGFIYTAPSLTSTWATPTNSFFSKSAIQKKLYVTIGDSFWQENCMLLCMVQLFFGMLHLWDTHFTIPIETLASDWFEVSVAQFMILIAFHSAMVSNPFQYHGNQHQHLYQHQHNEIRYLSPVEGSFWMFIQEWNCI